MRFPSLFFILVFGCLSANLAAQPTISSSYNTMLRSLLSFSVPTTTCTDLNTALKTTQIVLLDTREPREYAVSHLPGAQNVGYDNFDIKKLKNVSKNSPIVVYCSVGYRSEKIGEKLQKAGYKNVKNLYGSIFEWINEGYSVVDSNNNPTKKIHAYNKIWGIWLQKGEKVF